MTTATLSTQQGKLQLRKTAFAKRKAAKSDVANAQACRHLTDFILQQGPAHVVAGYMAIQTEIDPNETLIALSAKGFAVCLPVITGHAQPLVFRSWTPDSAMIEGDFGALIPRGGDLLVPTIAIVPLVAFDKSGARLGYGGGFYDRTLAQIKTAHPVLTIGFAYKEQELETVPTDEFDQVLDYVVTQNGILKCGTNAR